MAYIDEGIDQRAELLSGDAVDSIIYYAKALGLPVTVDPASAFITLMDNRGATLVARTAATIAANGKLSFSQAWPLVTYPYQEDCVALWEWQVGTTPSTDRQLVDIVKSKLVCPIDSSDLIESYPNLLNSLAAIDETDASKFIRRAWSQLLDRLRAGGTRPSLIMDRSRLVNPAIELAKKLCAEALMRQPGDLWDRRGEKADLAYNQLFAGLGALRYDRDEDNVPNDRDQRANKTRFRV